MEYNTQLHVGNKVRIKSKEWFDMCGYYFIDAMQQYCGTICTISSIDDDGIIRLKEDAGVWCWEERMLDLIEDEKEEKPLYHKGDKVLINSEEWYNNNKNDKGEIARDGIIFNQSKKEYCGKVFTINYSYKECGHIYYYLLEVEYSWSPWMFSPAKEDLSPNMKMSTTVIDASKIIAKDDYNNYQSNSSKFNLTKIIL
jgi:hypothetical protein